MNTQIWEKVQGLDLKEVKKKLSSRKGFWWNLMNDLDKIEREYRQFLYLIAANPGQMVVPWSQQLDDLWHEHILDTKKYAEDCQNLFGQFIHHNPHVDKGTALHSNSYRDTKKMYREAFQGKAKAKQKAEATGTTTYDSSTPGCSTFMPIVFCGSSCDHSHSHSHSHDAGCHDAGHSHSCGGHSDGGHSCGGHSCGGHGCGSSCGSSCGGGGCGGGGD